MILLYLSNILLYLHLSEAAIKRPRGVPISKAGFYDPGHDFPCFDGSAIVPFEQINDDYCDCKDGSDEPGTPACPNGTFHCTNAGHLPKYIPSSRVNDGICDCCDGTDEYSGKVTCANYCKELGKQHREEEEQQRALVLEGHELYKEYCFKGKEAKREKQERLEELIQEKAGLDDQRNELEAVKITAEEPEKEAKDKHMFAWKAEKEQQEGEITKEKISSAFEDLDNNRDQLVSYQELQAHAEFDIDSNGDVSNEEAREYLEEDNEVNFETFSDKVWPHIKDIYKKSQPEGEPDVEQETPTTKPGEVEGGEGDEYDEGHDEGQDEGEGHPEPEEYDIDDDDEDEEEESDMDEYDPSAPIEEELSHEKLRPRGDRGNNDKPSDEDDVKDMPPYDELTQRLIEVADAARSAYNEVNDLYKEMDREISDIEAVVTMDLGEENEFYLLKGECYEFVDREYTYKMCPYSKATQRDKRGGTETSLGNWGKWNEDGNKYDAMIFEKGQNCWNGPDRSVRVKLHCGVHNELVSASEPNKCEYEFKFITPAVCRELPPDVEADPHDEL